MLRSSIRTTGSSAVCPAKTWIMTISALYELPFGRGKRWGGDASRWMDYAIGGWQLNGIYTLQGGTPFSITSSGTPSTARADRAGNISVSPGNIGSYVGETYALCDPSKPAGPNNPLYPTGPFLFPASSAPTTCPNDATKVVSPGGIFLAPGTAGRDVVRGPGFSNIDLALFKNFPITERIKGQFRVQAYNLTNTPHFSNPSDTNLNDGHIGQINSVLTNSWCQVELALRFTF